ncbi:MAG TPA: rhomboid family intramembrane serine protease [Candidatus Bathyarchaeia archaeon]
MLGGTGTGLAGESRIRDSPSVWMAVTLIILYVVFGVLGGDLVNLNLDVAFPFVQVNELVWRGWVWMLFTAMFLHADPVHLLGNVMFLLVFGTSLEEQVSGTRWLITYFASGLTGSLAFLLVGPLLGQGIALGASGAIWGLLGAAGGLRGTMAVVLFAGFNIFAGGGFLAHAGGLAMGLVLRRWWDPIARFFGIATPDSGSSDSSDMLG